MKSTLRSLSSARQRIKEYLSSISLTTSEKNVRRQFSKLLRHEPLEARIALSGEGLTDFVAQPAGALEGKIVYTSAGHGLEWNNSLNRWYNGRDEFQNTEIVESFGNQDQMSFYADYLLRAGATVVPMRPVGHQLNEVVLDNDSAGVTFTGSWTNSSSSVFYDEDYGVVADSVAYRFTSISPTETETATYTPDIPEAGFYPVYTWVLDSGNRTNQLYRIHDSEGGLTEIRVDHRKVGKGWVYLGTYHFDAGTSGSVEISNQSTDGGSVVIADAIRFGNGMGDLKDGPNGLGHSRGTLSGQPREDEAALLWAWRMIGQGNNPASVIGTGHVSAPTRMAEHMNANSNQFGTSVYIGFHSNAGGGRGAVGLIDQTFSDQTPNQPELALYTGRQINQDMQALNGQFEHNWSTRASHTFSSNFGEIDLGQNAEMDATIIETAFHDSQLDSELMRDPKVRAQLARSTYEATLEYFDNFGGLSNPTSQPSIPLGVTATTDVSGDITVSWTPGPTGVQGGTPTGHRVYVSRNGYSFSGYVEVAGSGAGSHSFAAADLDDDTYYFKVVAANSGGESPRSMVASASKPTGSGDNLLIVNGFDRNDRFLNERYTYPFPEGGQVDRVRPRYNNTFDYVVQVAAAIDSNAPHLAINTTSNEALIAGEVSLADYDAVVWITGEESTADDTFNGNEQTLVTNYLNAGGKLLVSGAEIGWDLDNLNNGRTFYNNQLKADYVSDDANTYNVTGAAGSIFAGLSFSFDDGSIFYDAQFPDRILPLGGATTALNYVGGLGGGAAIQYDGGATKVVTFGFPFETITSEGDRSAVMDRVLEFFELGDSSADFDNDNDVDGSDFLAWQRGYETMGTATPEQGDANGDTNVDADDLVIWQTQYAVAPALSLTTASTSTVSSEPTAFSESTGTQNLDIQLLSAFAQHVSLAQKSTVKVQKSQRLVAYEAERESAERAVPTPQSFEQDRLPILTTTEIVRRHPSSIRQDAFAELGLDELVSLRFEGL